MFLSGDASPAHTHMYAVVCSAAVMLFHEAWGRSLCSAMQRLVEVDQEYPGGVEHIYSPGCVPLLRCSGCCNDDKLACYPSRTHNITIQARATSHLSLCLIPASLLIYITFALINYT